MSFLIMCHNDLPLFNFSKYTLTAPLKLMLALISLEEINNVGAVSYITPYSIISF